MKSTNGDTPAVIRALRVFPLPLALALLLTVGCASRGDQPPPATRPLSTDHHLQGNTSVSPPVPPQAAREEQAPPALDAAPAAAGRKAEASPVSKSAPVAQMLRNAGRDARPSAQPEADFRLEAPAAINDGEAFPVEFGASGARQVHFLWRGKTLTVSSPSPRTGTFQALLPVPLDEKAESMPLTMTVQWADGKHEQFTADMPIKKRRYAVQKLRVAPKHVSPPPEMREKIKRDRIEMRAAVGKVTARQYWTLPMLRPVPGEVTSLYGSRRVYNGVPKNPHKGLDLDAGQGDPIHAADDGVVALVSDHYYGGNTVVIDHGLGVLTVYLHMSAFNTSVGQQVKRGEVIGYVGSTGRSTGPHLHLSLYVMGESVNIAPCLEIGSPTVRR